MKLPLKQTLIGFGVLALSIVAMTGSFVNKSSYDFDGENINTVEIGGEEVQTAELIPPEIEVLHIEANETQDHKAIFVADIEAFISCFNSVYQQDYANAYLDPLHEWVQLSDYSPYFEYESVLYRFSADKQSWIMPTLSFYVPQNGDGIYEIELTFDDHGYQESMYQAFKETCFYTLKVLLPTLTDKEIDILYKNLYQQTDANFWGDYDPYNGAGRPALDMMYCYESIGFYGYYGAGTANICIVPITEAGRSELEAQGIEIHSIVLRSAAIQ